MFVQHFSVFPNRSVECKLLVFISTKILRTVYILFIYFPLKTASFFIRTGDSHILHEKKHTYTHKIYIYIEHQPGREKSRTKFTVGVRAIAEFKAIINTTLWFLCLNFWSKLKKNNNENIHWKNCCVGHWFCIAKYWCFFFSSVSFILIVVHTEWMFNIFRLFCLFIMFCFWAFHRPKKSPCSFGYFWSMNRQIWCRHFKWIKRKTNQIYAKIPQKWNEIVWSETEGWKREHRVFFQTMEKREWETGNKSWS